MLGQHIGRLRRHHAQGTDRGDIGDIGRLACLQHARRKDAGTMDHAG